MKYEIKGNSTQVTYEIEDQHRKLSREQDESRGETIICQPEGGCNVVTWPPKESKKFE
jgi:hypothetical protein